MSNKYSSYMINAHKIICKIDSQKLILMKLFAKCIRENKSTQNFYGQLICKNKSSRNIFLTFFFKKTGEIKSHAKISTRGISTLLISRFARARFASATRHNQKLFRIISDRKIEPSCFQSFDYVSYWLLVTEPYQYVVHSENYI